jgi:hypothetical protein
MDTALKTRRIVLNNIIREQVTTDLEQAISYCDGHDDVAMSSDHGG